MSVDDNLVEINGNKTADMTYSEVIKMLKDLNDDDAATIELKVEREVQTLASDW